MYEYFNPSPTGRRVGDCSVRAISKALGIDWEKAYILIAIAGFNMGDMPSSDSVWGAVLRQNGFYKKVVPDSCPNCYTIKDFCKDNPKGIFVVGTGGHVVTIEDGRYFDTWDSGDEIVTYYWYLK